jgi:copper(I)-binding protein
LILAAAAAFMTTAAEAHQVKAGDLTLSNLNVRASLGANPNTAAYLTITNAGAKPDRLLGASCACAAKVTMHKTMNHGGAAMMMASGPVAIPAKGSAVFAPGGAHLMLEGVKGKLADGAMQQITLRFERAGAVKAGFHVKANLTPGADHAHH